MSVVPLLHPIAFVSDDGIPRRTNLHSVLVYPDTGAGLPYPVLRYAGLEAALGKPAPAPVLPVSPTAPNLPLAAPVVSLHEPGPPPPAHLH